MQQSILSIFNYFVYLLKRLFTRAIILIADNGKHTNNQLAGVQKDDGILSGNGNPTKSPQGSNITVIILHIIRYYEFNCGETLNFKIYSTSKFSNQEFNEILKCSTLIRKINVDFHQESVEEKGNNENLLLITPVSDIKLLTHA